MSFYREILYKKYIPLLIFAVAMGFLEAIVVVYVRELYYPDGFNFPLKPMPGWLIAVELVREICTLLMLGGVAWIAGKGSFQRLAVFLFLFGVWDIFYYIGLKIFLNWPESLFTWDILFLIPITWIGPVLAPVICSVIMIGIAVFFEWASFHKKIDGFKIHELSLLILGALVILFTFMFDFGKIIIRGDFLGKLVSLPENPDFLAILTTFVPNHYSWGIFTLGIIIILFSLIIMIKRSVHSEIH